MENILEILVAVAFVILILASIIYGQLMKRKWKHFDMFLKDGDLVDYYSGEERITYRVEKVGMIYCEIRNEDTGNIIKV